MIRYRVRSGTKTFADKGPDLLRPVDNARRALKALLKPGEPAVLATRFERSNGEQSAWKRGSRAEVVDRFGPWAARDEGDTFQVGQLEDGTGRFNVIAAVRRETVKRLDEGDLAAGAREIHSLIQHQFPAAVFAGGFVCKVIAGTTQWSDHAHHDAVDETQQVPKVPNDVITEWLSRMGKARCVDFDYLLGSRNGEVVIVAAPDYDIEPSGASDSHLWHNHISDVDHDGRRPPCAG